jgi:hypothetical protein
VLGIERGGGVYLGLPRSTTQIQAGDTLILYGQTNDIYHLDERKQDVRGALDRRKQERGVAHQLRKQEKLEKNTGEDDAGEEQLGANSEGDPKPPNPSPPSPEEQESPSRKKE